MGGLGGGSDSRKLPLRPPFPESLLEMRWMTIIVSRLSVCLSSNRLLSHKCAAEVPQDPFGMGKGAGMGWLGGTVTVPWQLKMDEGWSRWLVLSGLNHKLAWVDTKTGRFCGFPLFPTNGVSRSRWNEGGGCIHLGSSGCRWIISMRNENDCLYSAPSSLTYILERDTSALPSSHHSSLGTNRRSANGIRADGNPHKWSPWWGLGSPSYPLTLFKALPFTVIQTAALRPILLCCGGSGLQLT